MRIDVLSDVQGRLDHLSLALRRQWALGPADLLVIDGDLVDNGHEEQYRELARVLASHPHPEVLSVIGNHEFYNPTRAAESLERFGEWTSSAPHGSRPLVDEAGVELGLLVWFGTLDATHDTPHDVVLGDEQLRWLEATIAAADPTRPVLVFAHQPLDDTVSGTRHEPEQPWWDYADNYAEADRVVVALGSHPWVVFLTGHTHWGLQRDDWLAVRRGGRHPFTCVNTGSLQNQYGWDPEGHDGRGGEKILDEVTATGLRLLLDPARLDAPRGDEGGIAVECHDHRGDTVLRTVWLRPVHH